MTTLLSSPPEWRRSSPTRWYVVFSESMKRRWWDFVFRTPVNFSHVYALRWDGFNWLLFDPTAAFTDIAILPLADENAIHRLLPDGATALEVEAFRQPGRVRGRWWAGPMTCTEQVKALLGLPIGWVHTPWQLYRYLTEECAHGRWIENAGKDAAGNRSRAPLARVRKRFDPRGKRAPEGDQARAAGAA